MPDIFYKVDFPLFWQVRLKLFVIFHRRNVDDTTLYFHRTLSGDF